MEFGQSEAYLQELQAEGRDVPALDRKPRLSFLQAQVFETFWLMSVGRPIAVGMGGAIELGLPTADVILTAAAHGFEPAWFLRLVRALDTCYLAAAQKRQTSHGHRPPRSSSRPAAVPKGGVGRPRRAPKD